MGMSLPRAVPSAQGVDAAGVLAFLDGVEGAGMDLHSLMLLRHGHVVAEGWWTPYRPERVHLLYSLSKSFTSTAIGIAESEGLLSIEDRVMDFFPEAVPSDASPFVRSMRVRDLLAMASGHAADTWPTVLAGGPEMVRTFLSISPEKEPGTLFCYNQGCTYTLSAIISRRTGQRLVDYLRPRLFDPLGIDETHWRSTAEDIDQGFSGLHVTTESIAKLGQLYLQNGRWDGRQLVPERYVGQARSKQVDNSGWSENPDWQQGYGFQFWMCRHGAYRGDGACGQFCVVIPEADAVVVCTAQVGDMQAQADLFWRHLLPALSGDGDAGSAGADQRLADRLGRLSTAVIDGRAQPPDRAVTFAREGAPAKYADGLTTVRAEATTPDGPAGAGVRLTLVVDGGEYSFDVRPSHWSEGELPGIGPLLPPVALTAAWTGTQAFAADVVFLTAPHRLRLRGRADATPTFEAEWQVPPL